MNIYQVLIEYIESAIYQAIYTGIQARVYRGIVYRYSAILYICLYSIYYIDKILGGTAQRAFLSCKARVPESGTRHHVIHVYRAIYASVLLYHVYIPVRTYQSSVYI